MQAPTLCTNLLQIARSDDARLHAGLKSEHATSAVLHNSGQLEAWSVMVRFVCMHKI